MGSLLGSWKKFHLLSNNTQNSKTHFQSSNYKTKTPKKKKIAINFSTWFQKQWRVSRRREGSSRPSPSTRGASIDRERCRTWTYMSENCINLCEYSRFLKYLPIGKKRVLEKYFYHVVSVDEWIVNSDEFNIVSLKSNSRNQTTNPPETY